MNTTSNNTLSISNTGTGNLTVNSISYPAGFGGNFAGTIAPGATQNVTISFRPDNEGAFGGNISVNSTATSGNGIISASGTGAHTRIIGLTGNLSFGSATVNTTSNRTLSITNTGTGN
ncbi:MAG: choice-of-anchor D domain-containing protein, partial [Spartobacteria bacterium]